MSALQFDSRWLGLPLIAGVLSALVVTVLVKRDAPARPAPASTSAALAPRAAGAEAAPAAQRLRLTTVAALPAPPPPRGGTTRVGTGTVARRDGHAIPGRITRADRDARAGGDAGAHAAARRARAHHAGTGADARADVRRLRLRAGVRRARGLPVIAVRPPEVRRARRVGAGWGVLAGLTVAAAVAGGVAGLLTAPEDEPPPPRPAPARPAVLETDGVRLDRPGGLVHRHAALPAHRPRRPGRHGGRRRRGASSPSARRTIRRSFPPTWSSGPRAHPSRPRRGRGPAHGAMSSPRPGATDRMTVIVAPSTGGVVTLACLAPGDASNACADAARTLALDRGEWLRAGPEAAAQIALPAVLGRLNARRRAARAELAEAQRPAARRRAALQLAAAYGAAAGALAPVAAGRAAGLPPLLRALAADHRLLARAHAGGKRAPALRAGAAIERREQRLAALLERIGSG